MIRRRTVASLLAVAVLGIGVAGCGDDDGGRGEVGELKLGVLVPLTGGLGAVGVPGAEAADLAAAEVNDAAGDSGLKLTLVKEDTRSEPRAAQAAASTLIERDGVTAIAGPWGTDEVTATAENVTVAAGIPIVTPFATRTAITDLDDDDLVFRTPPSDALQGRAIARLVGEALGADATVATGGRDDPYATALVEEFTTAFEDGGGTVSENVRYAPGAAGLDPAARRLAAGDPDGWMIVDDADGWATMGPALVRAGGWDPARTFTGDALRSPRLPDDLGRPPTEGMRGSAPTSLGAPGGQAFEALWAKEAGGSRRADDARRVGAQSFDAVILIALAAAAGGSTDAAVIAENLQAVSQGGTDYTLANLSGAIAAAAAGEDIDYEGASGPIDLDDNGDPASADYRAWSYTGGKLVDVGEVTRITAE